MNLNVSGVYRIYNKKTDRSYVGQSINVQRRLEQHYRSLNSLTYKHHSTTMQEDWDKYGEESFEAELLEKCPENMLEEREKYWIDFYNSAEDGYNTQACYNKQLKEEIEEAIQKLISIKERI